MYEFSSNETLFLAIAALGLGMIMLIRGGNWTIDGAVFVARKYNISPLVVGFTIVAFGTSLPELLVSVNANLKDSPSIAIGNVIGSNIANILLVIGVTSIVATLYTVPKDIMRDMFVMLLSTCVLLALILTGGVSQILGYAMIVVLLSYVLWQYVAAVKSKVQVEVEELEEGLGFSDLKTAMFFLLCGVVFIALGAEFLVKGAQISAAVIGIPEAVVALSVIAIGTSLPELSTCVIAALRKQGEMVVGNIIGSNVFNVLMIVGATAIAKPILSDALDPQLISIDIWIMGAVSVLFASLALFYKKITPAIGVLFCMMYAAYMVMIYFVYFGAA